MSRTPSTIRPATRGDAEALGRLGARLVEMHHAFDADRFMAPTAGTARGYGGYLAGQIGDDGTIVLVAERAGHVVGYVYGAIEGADYMALRGPGAVLHDVIVAPAERRGGVGRALVGAILEAFTAREAPRVVLSTAARNETARAFFEGLGFRETMVELTRELP